MISHWFTPDDRSSIRPDRLSKLSLWHSVVFLEEMDVALSDKDVLLVGFDRISAQRIKKNLYQFVLTNTNFRIVDCGLLHQNNHDSFIPILKEIVESGSIIIFLCPPISFMKYQIVGSRMASVIRESNLDDDIHLRTEEGTTMLQYIGTQRHLIAEYHNRIEGHLRLSDLREDISLAEPCIRDSDIMMFNCDSLSASEAGYMSGMSSSGLNAIESCQLFRYAGAAQSLSTIGIYGYAREADSSGMLANTLAQMIWYMLEGTTLREDPEQSTLSQYLVQTKDHELTLNFYKSESSGRWWIENKVGRKVPCSYADYRKACEEDYSAIVIKSVLE